MIRALVHDPILLARKSAPATEADRAVLTDLRDTLLAYRETCAGMAANMIGVTKRIIAVSAGPVPLMMVNPVILRKSGEYTAEEGCLSLLSGPRRVTRWQEIEVAYLDERFRPQKRVFTGWTAQIIQHETDHCDGVLI